MGITSLLLAASLLPAAEPKYEDWTNDAARLQELLAEPGRVRGSMEQRLGEKPVNRPQQAVSRNRPPPLPKLLEYEQLFDMEGRRVRVFYDKNAMDVVRLEAVADDKLTVRVRKEGGTAIFELPRDRIRYVERLTGSGS